MNPRVTDNDAGEITVALEGRELRGWSYANDGERRHKMLLAREYVEGWSDGREVMPNVAQACAVRLEARPADNSKEWTEIFPAQLEWVAKAGHQVRAIEVAAQPPAAPVETDADLPTTEDVRGILGPAHGGCSAGNEDARVPSKCPPDCDCTADCERLNGFWDNPSDNLDAGSAFVTHNVDDTITIKVRSPGDRVSSEVEMSLDAWLKLRSVPTLNEPQPAPVSTEQAHEDVRREREAMAERDRYAKMTTAEKCAAQGDGFINDCD